MSNDRFMVISLCADTFSVNSVTSEFKEKYPDLHIVEFWTRFLLVEDSKGNQYRIDYRVDDETYEPGFGELININSTNNELLDEDTDTVDAEEVSPIFKGSNETALEKIIRLSRTRSK